MSSHRRPARPRYGRIAALACSVTVVLVTALGGLGVLGTSRASAGDPARPASYIRDPGSGPTTPYDPPAANGTTKDAPSRGPAASGAPSTGSTTTRSRTVTQTSDGGSQTALPADSGNGRRVVFSRHQQRVWLVGNDADHVDRTYLVSGSLYDNLQPGTYSVYSRSRWAVGVDDSGVMQYFVRFTQGPTGAAIGFHSIPTKDGHPLETVAQLGTPESHGCIRQRLPDAVALWGFAPVGTKVVVVA